MEDRHVVLDGLEKLGAQAIQVACHAQKFFSQADQHKEKEQQPSLVQPLWHVIKFAAAAHASESFSLILWRTK